MTLFIAAALFSITGNVHAATGPVLAHAHVLARSADIERTTETDARGNFSLALPAGSYRVSASDAGYAPVTVGAEVAADATISIALEPLDSPKLRQIGSVTVDGRLAPIAGAIPTVALSRSDLDAFGDDRLIDGLQDLPGTTFSRPDGGAASAIAVVSLRGPDPSESLLTLDGQVLNDGNTGDVDLSRLPVAAFSAVDVSEGLGPEDSNGSNTFGGSIDFVSLRPTLVPHESASLSGGSFGQSEAWINATGTLGKLGYATAVDDQNEAGFVSQTVPLCTGTTACDPVPTHLGSTVAAHSVLATATYSFSQAADVTARVFALGDVRDQSSALNGIDKTFVDGVPSPTYGDFIGPGEQTFAQDLRAYQIRARAPLGSGELTADLSESDDGISIAGGSATPYDFNHIDHRYDATFTWQRIFQTSQFAVGGYTRYESLALAGVPDLGQSINVYYARGGFEPVAKLRIDAGVFESHYTTFGSNLDGRFGAVYAADPSTSIRFSLGTGFRAPLLIERYAFPYSQLTLDGNNVFVGQGSPSEVPEKATEYELGASHEFSRDSTLDVSLYRTNLRDPVEIFYPLAAVDAGDCKTNSYADPLPECVSYNSNVGNAVYEGTEIRYTQRFSPAHVVVTARYGLNVAYPKDLNAQFSNPTSGGSLVDNEQFLGIPQQQGSLEAEYADRGVHAALSGSVRGKDNELNQGTFAVVNALIGHRFASGVDLSIAGTNLFNAVAGPFTQFGAGAPYRGIGGPLATDALFIEPVGVRLILTVAR